MNCIHGMDEQEFCQKCNTVATAEDRTEIERLISQGFTSGRLDSDEGDGIIKYISWELSKNGGISILDVWIDEHANEL